ncbi:MAG: helix-turn-helix transcriptional regulator [Clostridia bacterium]|nr:helix-turn-helix transcriptional regulator [Clostridia bacterium]
MKESNKVLLQCIGNRFKEFREDAGFSRKEASDRIGITARTLASYERGEREVSMSTAIRMAAVYGTTFTKLTDYKSLDSCLCFECNTAKEVEGKAYDRQKLQEHAI